MMAKNRRAATMIYSNDLLHSSTSEVSPALPCCGERKLTVKLFSHSGIQKSRRSTSKINTLLDGMPGGD